MMKKQTKKWISLFTICALGIAIVFSLTACSEQAPSSFRGDVTTSSTDAGNSAD